MILTRVLQDLIIRTYKEHKRNIFNGNNYSDEWVKEAEKRGLLNLRTLADATPHYTDEKNVKMFEKAPCALPARKSKPAATSNWKTTGSS